MNIAIGADHAGFDLKKVIISYLTEKGHNVEDFGCYSNERKWLKLPVNAFLGG